MSILLTVYIATGIFGLGVTIIDMIGLIGDDDSDSTDANGDIDSDGDIDTDTGSDSDSDSFDAGEIQGSNTGHDRKTKGNPLLLFLGALRSFIYFCMGFGPAGVIVLLFGRSGLESLIWSSSFGILTFITAKIVRKVMKKDLNSIIKTSVLLMEKGEVTVSIGKGEIGKIKVVFGGRYVERYARCLDKSISIKKGKQVLITETDDEFVYVKEV